MIKQIYKRIVLSNGLRLILVPDSSKRVLTSMILFGVGSRSEAEKEAGISHVLEHMHYKGTKKRPSPLSISEFIENIGGEHNAFTSKEYTGYYVKVAGKFLENSLDFISDLVVNPLLPAKDLEQEKKVILQEVDMYEDLPSEVAANNFEEALFGKNALGRDVIGFKSTIKSVTKEDLVRYRQGFYTSGNAVLILAGNFADLTEDKVIKLIEKYFNLHKAETSEIPTIKLNNQKSFKIVNKPTEQSHLVIGFRGLPTNHPDRYKMRLLALILGGSMSSRMFTEIREKRGLAYAVRTSTGNYRETGSIETLAGVPHERVLETVEAIIAEYEKMKDGVTESELKRAKEIIYGRMLINMEDTNEVASHFGMAELLSGKIQTLDEVAAIYEKITVSDIEKTAKRYLVPEGMALSYVGPNLKEEQLKQFNF
ncbi:MAG: pitrilysin family protein [Candidatus Berkelbacteria bacterium]|nr:pitrilysin family protein [Candidatus Berkelbacteria bacterium]